MNFFLPLLFGSHLVIALYLGWRFKWAFSAILPAWLQAGHVYWPLAALIAFSFPLTHFLVRRYFDLAPPPWLLLVTAVASGVFIIGFTTTLLTDIAAFAASRLNLLPAACAYVRAHPLHLGLIVLAIVALQTIYAIYQAHVPRETHYALRINKPLADGSTRLRIVQISDMHITDHTSAAAVERLVAQVNALAPDLVVFSGDTVDRSIKPFNDKSMPAILARLQSRYGVYAIMGNHEYYGESPLLNIIAYRQARMRVLRDQVTYLPGPGITLIGRDDWIRDRDRSSGASSHNRSPAAGASRLPLSTLVARADKKTPLILLDHQPRQIGTAAAQGIDLQFSGHTHNGQLFPANLAVAFLFKKAWGLWQNGAYHLIVSCGFGTWGPPMRLSSYSEIVVADIDFAEK